MSFQFPTPPSQEEADDNVVAMQPVLALSILVDAKGEPIFVAAQHIACLWSLLTL